VQLIIYQSLNLPIFSRTERSKRNLLGHFLATFEDSIALINRTRDQRRDRFSLRACGRV